MQSLHKFCNKNKLSKNHISQTLHKSHFSKMFHKITKHKFFSTNLWKIRFYILAQFLTLEFANCPLTILKSFIIISTAHVKMWKWNHEPVQSVVGKRLKGELKVFNHLQSLPCAINARPSRTFEILLLIKKIRKRGVLNS